MNELATKPCYCIECEWQGMAQESVMNTETGALCCPICHGDLVMEYTKSVEGYTIMANIITDEQWKVAFIQFVLTVLLRLLIKNKR